jgi:hypothetical protein
MGKDSLLKSTSKKKTTAKKKGAAKAAAPKTPAAGKSVKAKAKTAKGKKAMADKAVKAGKAAAAVKKKAPSKKPTLKELLFYKFDRYIPQKPFTVQAPGRDPEQFASPPFISATDPQEAERLKSLLLEKLDLAAMAEAAGKPASPQKAAPAAPAEPVTSEPAPASAAEEGPAPAPESAPAAAPAAPPQGPPDREVLEGFGGPEPLSKTSILAIAAFAMLVFLLVGASYSNTHKFYLKSRNGALEIWQGAFAPMGEQKLVALPGMTAPTPIRDVYAKDDVFPLAFDYYIARADALLDAEGLPDLEGIKAHLNSAREFAVSPELKRLVRIRIDYIDLFILRYKAEVAAAKGAQEDLDAAVGYLKQAAQLAVEEDEAAEIAKRIEALQNQKALLAEAAAAEAKQAEAEMSAEAEAPAAEATPESAGEPSAPAAASKSGH